MCQKCHDPLLLNPGIPRRLLFVYKDCGDFWIQLSLFWIILKIGVNPTLYCQIKGTENESKAGNTGGQFHTAASQDTRPAGNRNIH